MGKLQVAREQTGAIATTIYTEAAQLAVTRSTLFPLRSLSATLEIYVLKPANSSTSPAHPESRLRLAPISQKQLSEVLRGANISAHPALINIISLKGSSKRRARQTGRETRRKVIPRLERAQLAKSDSDSIRVAFLLVSLYNNHDSHFRGRLADNLGRQTIGLKAGRHLQFTCKWLLVWFGLTSLNGSRLLMSLAKGHLQPFRLNLRKP